MLRRIIDRAEAAPYITCGLVLACLASMFLFLPDLRQAYRLGELLADNRSGPEAQQAVISFRWSDHRRWNHPSLCQLYPVIEALKRRFPELSFMSPFDVVEPRVEDGQFFYYGTVALDCPATAMAQSESMGRSVGPPVRRGFFDDSSRSVALEKGLGTLLGTPWQPLFVSADERLLSVQVVLTPTQRQSHEPAALQMLTKELAATVEWELARMSVAPSVAGQAAPALEPAEIEVLISGPLQHHAELLAGVEQDGVLNLLTALIILVFFGVVLRARFFGVVYLITLTIVTLVLFGLMASVGRPVDIVNHSIFVLLAISTLQDFLFILVNARENHGGSYTAAARELAVPSLLTSLTTAVTFGTLVLTGPATLSTLGAVAAVGALLEWLMCFAAVPALLRLLPEHFGRVAMRTRPSGRALMATIRADEGFILPDKPFGRLLRPTVLIFGVAVAGWGAFLFFTLQPEGSPIEVFSPQHPFRRAAGEFKREMGYESMFYLDFAEQQAAGGSAVLAQTLSAERSVSPILEQVRQFSGVSGVFHIDDVIAWAQVGVEPYFHSFVSADVQRAGILEQLSGPSGSRALIFVADSDHRSLAHLLQQTSSLCASGVCSATGDLVDYVRFNEMVYRALNRTVLVGFFVIALVILLIPLVGPRGVTWRVRFIAIVSSFWGPVAALIGYSLFSVPINFATTVFFSIVIGLCGDNAIHYLCGPQADFLANVRGKRSSVLYMTLVMVLCPLVLMASAFETSRGLGLLLAFALLVMTFGDTVLLKALTEALLRPEKCQEKGA